MSGALKVCPQCGTEYPANARFCEVDGTALRSAAGSEDLVGSIVADRYHVMKKLGEGGMGQVYLVEHVKMGRKSALKVMHPAMVKDVDAISRFNREAANASRISHPNVASVYDFGETKEGIIYLAMEFVDGPPLTSVIESQGALPAKRAAEIVRQTSEALAVAHDMGIVHRDLKPDNIMIAKTRDGADLVKVVDFGIAKAAGIDAQKVTKTGLVVGTPEYMSPEQLAGDKLDGRSDIYSLGLVAFNMLTGKLPFPSDSAQESMIMRLTDKPKALLDMKPDVSWPPEVQAVMDKALERDATLRYQTATEFGRALYQAVDRMPETAAAEMGTQVIGAQEVPATRVGAPPVPPRGATVPMPTPVSAAPVAQSTAPAKKRSMVPVIGGIAAVVVIGAVTAKMLGGKPAAPAPAPAPALATDTTHDVKQTATQASAPAAKYDKPATPAQTSAPSTKSIAEQLRGMIDDSKILAKGPTVQAKVQKLEPDLKTSEEIYLAALLLSNVAATKGDTTAACAELEKVASKVASNEKEMIDSRKFVLSCP